MTADTEVVLKINVGSVYRFRQGYRYRVTGFPLDAHGCQEVVAYVGLEGPDTGREFTCSVWNFGLCFTLADPPRPLVERVAGRAINGKGA